MMKRSTRVCRAFFVLFLVFVLSVPAWYCDNEMSEDRNYQTLSMSFDNAFDTYNRDCNSEEWIFSTDVTTVNFRISIKNPTFLPDSVKWKIAKDGWYRDDFGVTWIAFVFAKHGNREIPTIPLNVWKEKSDDGSERTYFSGFNYVNAKVDTFFRNPDFFKIIPCGYMSNYTFMYKYFHIYLWEICLRSDVPFEEAGGDGLGKRSYPFDPSEEYTGQQ